MRPAHLIDVLLQQTQALQETLDVAVRQREALKSGRLDLLQGLMKELHDASFRAQALDRRREQEAASLARTLGVHPRLSEILAKLNEGEREALSSVAAKFSLVVRKLQAEMKIISRLADESQRLGDLMLSEWRRMENAFSPSSGFDLKG